MIVHRSSMFAGSLPMSRSESSSTAAATVAALPSMIGSPHPMIPSSVSILRNSHRGGTVYVVIDVIFIGLAFRSVVVVDVSVVGSVVLRPRRGDRLSPHAYLIGAVASAIKRGTQAQARGSGVSPFGGVVGSHSTDGEEFGAFGKNFAPGLHSADPDRRRGEEFDLGGTCLDRGKGLCRCRGARVGDESQLECGGDDLSISIGGDDDAGTGSLALADLVDCEYRAGTDLHFVAELFNQCGDRDEGVG